MYDHEHKFFLFKVSKEFEPFDKRVTDLPVYIMVEYGYLACNCGEVIKSKVKKQEDTDGES